MRVSVWFVSTLCVLFYNLYAEAITPENIGCFQISLYPLATHKVSPTVVQVENVKVALPASSVPLTLETDGIWRDTSDSVFAKQTSDHALEGKMVDGDIPVYTWNTWGFQSTGGFSASNTESLSQYQTGRLKEQIGILAQIFSNSPEAIICLQEVNEQTAKARTAILNGLKSLGVDAEYLNQTGTQSFGQVILYRKDRYSIGGKSVFKSTADPQQSSRAHKVFFKELTGKHRQLAVVNVRLAYNSPNILGLLNELITYSQGAASPKPLAVITGDFNYTVGKYTPTNPKATVKQVGKSVIWYRGAPSTKQTANNVDGFIIVQP